MVRVFGKRNSTSVGTEECAKEKVKAVLKLLQKNVSLTKKQAEFYNELCIARFLRSKGNNVKKAAKQLRATLEWRESLDVDYLTADEFSPELAFGTAYVPGQDDERRPVLIVRLKPEHLNSHSQKQFFKFIMFTMEVAIATMPLDIEQCVLILDAGCLKKGSPGLSIIVQLLKMLGDHYPDRLARTFLVDAPPIFYYLWKGIGPFIDLGMREKLRFIFSKNYITLASSAANHVMKGDTSYSSCNLWTEHDDVEEDDNFFIDTVRRSVIPKRTQTMGAALVADKQQARSLSFASPATISCWEHEPGTTEFRSFRFDIGSNMGEQESQTTQGLWGNLSSVLKGPRREEPRQTRCNQKDRSIDIFRHYFELYASTYNEAAYRAIMKPPLGGLASIVSSELKRKPDFCFRGTGVQVEFHHLHTD